MRLYLVLVSLCAIEVPQSSAQKILQYGRNSTADCEALGRRATECVRIGMGFLDLDFQPPHDMNAVDEFCSSRTQYLKCARQYIQCLRTVPRQIYIIVIQNVNKLLRDVCAPGKKVEFVQHMRCVNRRTLPAIADPVSMLSDYYSYIAGNVTREDDLIPWTCCAYFSFYHQFQESLQRLCDPSPTPPDTIQFYFNSINQVVSDAIDLGCGQYSSKEACDRKVPRAMSLFRGTLFGQSSKIDFLSPLLEIAKRIS